MTDQSPDDGAACRAFFDCHKLTLAALAHEAIEEGYSPDEFVLICIDATNPDWKLVVQNLIEVFDVEHKGEEPDVVLGTMSTEDVIDVFTQLIPAITAQLAAGAFPTDAVRIIAVHGERVGLFVEELEEKKESAPAGTGGLVN